MKVETCKNCGRTVGKLEQAYVFHEDVVCQDCYAKLTEAEDKQVQAAIKKPIGVKVESTPPQTEQQKSVPQQVPAERVVIVKEKTITKSGKALVGGWVCLTFAIITGYGTLGCGACIYVPLLIGAIILSIIAMAQGRILGGIILLIACFALPVIIGLVITGGTGFLGYETLKSVITDANTSGVM
jgi:hypothetical protein